MKKISIDYEWLVRSVVEGDALVEPRRIRVLLDQVGIGLGKKTFYCIAVRSAETITDVHQLAMIYNVCVDAVKQLDNEAYSYIGAGFCIMLIVAEEGRNRIKTARKLYDLISEQHGYTVQLGVGRGYRDVEKLIYSRVEAYEALANMDSAGQVSFIDDIYVSHNITTGKMENEKQRVIELFKSGDMDRMMSCVEKLAENVRIETRVRDGDPYPTSIKRTIIELIFEIMHIVADAGLDVDKLMDYKDPYNKILEMGNTPDLLDWFFDITKVFYQNLIDKSIKTENNMMKVAKKCIYENIYNPELSLLLVSNVLEITPTYFSAFFMREEGVGFNEFITNLRIKHAQELLLTSAKKVNAIAAECGFRSSSYFISVFRKQTGMSPGEFRNKK